LRVVEPPVVPLSVCTKVHSDRVTIR
jgi:hypothetical protein